jgi:hypothetical protein
VDTEIRYVELVRGDLAAAAARETERRRGRTRAPGPASRLARPLFAAAAVTVVLAGAIGWLATSGGLSSDDSGDGAITAGETGASSATGATGATGGRNEFGYLGPSATPAPAAGDQSGVGAGVEVPADDLSRIIRTAQLGLVIPRESFDARFANAADVASDNGGYVQDSVTRRRSGELTMRVPAEGFDDALRELRELGDVEVQRIQGQDVTDDYLDLQARLRIAKSRREVLLRLMNEANGISQTIRVQNALDETQLRVEQIQGQINVLDDRTSLATITLSLREQGTEPEEEVDAPSIPNAFERSVAGFVGVIAAVVVGLGYLIPLALLGGLVWLAVVLVQRRRTT